MHKYKDSFLNWMQRCTDDFRVFNYHNQSIIDLFFTLLYAAEQVVLVIFTFVVKDTRVLSLVVSFYAIIVLTTFSIHKIMLASRNRLLEEKLRSVDVEVQQYHDKINDTARMSDLIASDSLRWKDLYSHKPERTIKRGAQ